MKNQNPIFRGIATALVTPTTPEGIDFDRFGTLIDWADRPGDQRPGHLRAPPAKDPP